MSIPGISSGEAHSILLNTKNGNNKMLDDIKYVHDLIVHKHNIQRIQYDYAQMLLARISPSNESNGRSDVVFANKENVVGGLYDEFGTTVYPKALTERNLFNISSQTGYLFRSDIEVRVGSHFDGNFEMFMKHETIQEKPFFTEFTTSGFFIEVSPLLPAFGGSTVFNSVQIHPHLPGNSIIERIEVKEDISGDYIEVASKVPCCASRIMMTRNYNMVSVRLWIEIKEPINEAFFFGLKHLYFFSSHYDEDSEIIFSVERPNYIRSIHEKVSYTTPYGRFESTLRELGAKLYADYDFGQVRHELKPATDQEANVILRNIKKFYVKMPVPKTGISTFFFHSIQER